jgi:replicative DNA helicase
MKMADTIKSLDSERCLLGAMLADPDQIDQLVADGLQATDFWAPLHRRAWQALVALRLGSEPIDEVTLWQALQASAPTRDEHLRDLASWSAMGGAIPAHASKHAQTIMQLARLRDLRFAALQVAEGCEAPGADPVKLGARLTQQLDTTAPPSSTLQGMGSIMQSVFVEIEERSKREAPAGIKTGFAELDGFIGALEATRLYVLAARPGMGKTAMMLQLCLTAALKGPVYIASLEMTGKGLGERALALEARVDAGLIREPWRLSQTHWSAILQASARLAKLPLHIDDASNVTPAELASRVRAFARKHGQPALVAVDYLQRLSAPDTGTANRAERVGAGSWACKAIAKDHHCPVLLLSQLNRECENRRDKHPKMSDLKESGDIEQDADVVLALYREGYYEADADQTLAEVLVLKNRHGSMGTANARWIGAQTRFADVGFGYE